jgi:hypothetical protein
MFKHLSSFAIKHSKRSSHTPRERERERERESILRAKIQQLRNEIREKFLELYATILKLYQMPLQDDDFNEMRTFELLKESIFTFRDDKPENKLFKFLGNICI